MPRDGMRPILKNLKKKYKETSEESKEENLTIDNIKEE
jgi:hypothetical protein